MSNVGYRTYVRNDSGGGVLLIVFDERGHAVFGFDTEGNLYPTLAWRHEDSFDHARHFTRYDSNPEQ